MIYLSEFLNCSLGFILGITDSEYEGMYKKCPLFSVQLRKVMLEKKKTEYRLVKTTGISKSLFYSWLSGKSLPSIDNIIKLANALECSIDYLVGRE